MRSEFDRIIVNIQSLSRTEMGFKSFKTFDGEIYKANNPSDYYQIYGSDHNKFDKLVSIYAIISFLKDNMPFKLHKNYLKEVSENLHDTINQGISINQLFKESPFLDGLRSNYIAACSGLINEIDTLTQLIKEFIEQL